LFPQDARDGRGDSLGNDWSFMLENKQLYRLMNGMDGVLVDRVRVTAFGEHSFEAATRVVRAWFTTARGDDSGAEVIFEDLWAVQHGMAALHLDRSVPFDIGRAKDCVAKLLVGTEEQTRRALK